MTNVVELFSSLANRNFALAQDNLAVEVKGLRGMRPKRLICTLYLLIKAVMRGK
jgi:hypothetical protein